MNHIDYDWGALRPTVEIWWRDSDGTLIDFSSGYTWSFKVSDTSTALLTKTTGIVGAAGSGTEPTGVPNVVITPSGTETQIGLSTETRTYTWQLTATTGGLPRIYQGTITIHDVIT